MQKSKLITKILIIVGLTSLLIIIVVWAVSSYRQPLGPALDTSSLSALVSTNPPIATTTSVAEDLPEPSPRLTPRLENPNAPVPTSTPGTSEICGESAVWNVLVLGSDSSDLYYPQGSDLTRVLRVNFQNKTVTSFAFSRDLWVDATNLDLTNPNITFTKLGMVFYEARLRSAKTAPQETMQDGINAIANTLATNFNLISDHYIALDLEKLPVMIDALGGVQINIATGFTDPKSGMTFQAGEQTLNGMQTAIYARAFLDTDLNRIERDNLLVTALRQKLLDPAIWVKLPDLLLQFKDAIKTDLSTEQVNHLACLMRKIQAEEIIQEGVKVEWTSPGPEGSLLWDRTSVLIRLLELELIR